MSKRQLIHYTGVWNNSIIRVQKLNSFDKLLAIYFIVFKYFYNITYKINYAAFIIHIVHGTESHLPKVPWTDCYIIHKRPKLLQSEHNWVNYMDIIDTNTKTINKMKDTCT